MPALSLLVGGLDSAVAAKPDAAPTDGRSQVRSPNQVQLEGEFEALYQDFKDHSRLLYSLKLPNGRRVPLHFAKEPPTHLLTGDHVRAEGQASDDGGVLLASGKTNVTSTTTNSTVPSSIPVPNTFGDQRTLVILVNFQDHATEPYTVSDAQNMFFETANTFVLENSYGQTSLSGTVVGWYTIPDSIATCNTSQMASDAQNAAVAAGTNLANYTRYVYVFPYNSACGWAGLSYVGGNPSQSFINGDSLDFHIVDHELGHAFGLWHSHLLDCGTGATIGSSCNVVEYGDLMDSLGVPQTASPHFNAFQKERLGWLNYGASPAIQTVETSGTYTISPFESGGSGPTALKILKSTDPTTGAKTWYYLEARQAIGFDAFLANSTYYTQNETTGVLFHAGTDGDGNSSDLLDITPATPTSSGWFDMSLAAGRAFEDSGAGVTFTTEDVTSTGATVSVQFSAAGALTVATAQPSYSPGQTVSITATATYQGSPAANVSVSFTVTKANGTLVKGSATTGRNGVAVYKLRLRASDPHGIYVAGSTAAIQGKAFSASTNFTVQ